MNIHVAPQKNAWTAEQQTTALQMRAEGAGNGDIGRAIGKSRDAVRNWFINREKAKQPKEKKPTYWDHGDRAETAIRMWKEGFSGTQIAEKLRGGITRSAVIAWLNRNGYQRGFKEKVRTQTARAPKPLRKAPALRKPANGRNVPHFRVEAIPEPAIIGDPLLLTLEQISFGQCRYICSGTGDEALFCGNPTHKGSWCAGHRQAVFWADAPVMKQSKHAWWGQ